MALALDYRYADKNLSQLIEETVASLQKETKSTKASQIHQAIELNLRDWMDKVEKLSPMYKVSELLPVGSYAEGTKIIQPDEFDFLAVLDELSQPGAVIKDDSVSNYERSLVRLKVADDKSDWKNLCRKGHLQCFNRVNFPNDGEDQFGHVFIRFIRQKVREINKKDGQLMDVYSTPFSITCKIRLQTENDISLFLRGTEYRTPNILITFEVEKREITVDLSPAIRYYDIDACFKPEDCAGQAFADLVLNRKSLLFIGTADAFDLKVTVTEAEVQYMQSVMKPEHKLIYTFLKYIEKIYEKSVLRTEAFTSYQLKTICIHHDTKCQNEERTVEKCLKSVLEELDVCTQQDYVISIVNKHLFLRHDHFTPGSAKRNREYMLTGIKEMFRLPTDIRTAEAFDAYLKHFIEHDQKNGREGLFDPLSYIGIPGPCSPEDQGTTPKADEISATTGSAPVPRQWDEATVSRFTDMGFEQADVRQAMEKFDNLNEVHSHLLKSSNKHSSTSSTSSVLSSQAANAYGVQLAPSSRVQNDEKRKSSRADQEREPTSEIIYKRRRDL